MSAKKQTNKKASSERRYINPNGIRNFVSSDSIMQGCLQEIKKILRTEGCKTSSLKDIFNNKELALNLDLVEEKKKTGTSQEQNRTVDFVVCLEKDFLLLVEAKLRVENVDNILKTLPDKIENSKQLLRSSENFVHCDKNVVVLMGGPKCQQLIRELRNKLIGKTPYVRPLSVKDFYSCYF